jgi:hypothetical protein
MALQSEDKASSNVLVGRFGTEIALVMDAAHRHGRPVIAGSDQLDGLAVVYALADEPLIGEEVFAVPGYLSDTNDEANRNLIIDRLRWLVVLAILLLLVAPSTFDVISGG